MSAMSRSETAHVTRPEVDPEEVRTILKPYKGRKGTVIAALQAVQAHYGYVPEAAVDVLAEELDVLPVDLYGILTFYAQFYLTPRGKHTIRVCQGTACYVMGGRMLLEQLQEELGVEEGGTTQDGLFTLETVACLGCCGMAPVVTVDDRFFGHVTPKGLEEILATYRAEEPGTGEDRR